MTAQVRYHNVMDKNAPRQYWRNISYIAHLIGLALVDGTSIKVAQTKEKFGSVCVYCSIDNWGDSDDDVLRNARHYRTTYTSFFELFPHYKDAIKFRASFPELLCETKKELDELIKNNVVLFCFSARRNNLHKLLNKVYSEFT